ncbi:MAG: hypothetical protein KatS3mg110_0790 [Pirellulaceae bacterium]|nr:MAG: hypothetical protein KatS3mg110_0790 [Pirellulaceae bacterium]
MSRYPLFDRSLIRLRPLALRGHQLTPEQCLPLEWNEPSPIPELHPVAQAIRQARLDGRPVVFMMGAHPIKLGLSRFIIDLMARGWLTHVAMNGAGLVHDFELALGPGTSEDVAHWVRQGQFGLWEETGRLNHIAAEAARNHEGLGEAAGRILVHEQFPHRELSILAAGWQLGVPVTIHVAIGCDIVHAHASCDGAAWGAATYTDFLIFAHTVSQLEGGVFLNVGTAVTGPEIYLKALSMARNTAHQQGRSIRRFTTAVFDLVRLPENYRDGAPPSSEPLYYYRPWKTILVRTVADGGKSHYVCGDHRRTIPALWHLLAEQTPNRRIEEAHYRAPCRRPPHAAVSRQPAEP